MSSEWWPILAVFWVLYLADGLRGGRRSRLFFHHWRAARAPLAHVTQSSWFFAPPAPSGWLIEADDLPASLASEGLTNWPAGSASRPPPLPDHIEAFRWEDVTQVEERLGWIFINARRFAPATPALTAAALGALARELAPLSADARAARLQTWHSVRFRAAHLKRRLRSVLVRTRGLAFLNTVQAALLAGLTAYVLLDGPAHVSPALRDALAARLPHFLALCASLHVAAVIWFYRLHRQIHPRAGQERASLIFTALLVPAQALRLRMHLTAKLAAGLHPLAVALVAARRREADALITDTLRDLRWPRLPETMPPHVARLARSSAALLEPVIHQVLAKQGASHVVDTAFTAPQPESTSACAYCPRCGDQFTRPDARCPHGVPLARF